MASNTPENLKYTKEHEWVRVEGNRAVVGITDHAQRTLGDVVYVELPKVGDKFEASAPFGSIESVKAVSEAFSPVSGKVVKVNEELNSSPEDINADPYGDGWLIEIELSNSKELNELLSASQYQDYVKDSE
ncbi:glycine cleavage system protein GcvH [Vitiosangium sp. GDMCC 1.1324]|uniref:glycine cleavage system protein GcvH n=1 Tax=Vitiosangium sp. (strain GDMCC 1.1324) TaxID=2138576 RepID=UPI000D3364A5|nr:glycine cleavage system protein GcvH [Vitiosangium sp. GDMCC 1.1324]PTL78325.1 glycine cleavage system protein GcvH [Vitiosangium sp. GDMCC 1.1324]